MLEKIKEFFEKIKCPAEYILKNKYENPKDENLIGEEINLPPYAIIHKGKNILLDDIKYKKLFNFEKTNNLEITCFYSKNCNPVEGVLNQLKSEGYKIIYKKI